MKLYILTTAFFATFFLISCKKDNEVNLSKTDYIIFWTFLRRVYRRTMCKNF